MMHTRNLMRTIAAEHAATDPKTRVGTVTAYNPSTYAVKVMFQPAGVESGWIPIKTAWVGNGWGMQAGPTIGDLVSVTFQEGGHDAGVVLGSLYNNVEQPMAVPSGELWVKHSSGSFLKFLNNGDVSLHTARDLLLDATRDIVATAGRHFSVTAGGNFSVMATGFAHLTSAIEATTTAPLITEAAPLVTVDGALVQGQGPNGGAATMQGPLHVVDTIHSDAEVTAQSTPLHTHEHTSVTHGSDNTGGPTP